MYKKIKRNTKLTKRLIRMDFREVKTSLFGFIGGFLTILALGILTDIINYPLIMAPFGASCLLVFVAHKSPLAQPKNVILGHLLSSAIGLIMKNVLSTGVVSLALTVGVVIFLMTLLNIKHPPAGADPIVIFKENLSWDFLITPVLSGSIIVVLFAIMINNMDKTRKYPINT